MKNTCRLTMCARSAEVLVSLIADRWAGGENKKEAQGSQRSGAAGRPKKSCFVTVCGRRHSRATTRDRTSPAKTISKGQWTKHEPPIAWSTGFWCQPLSAYWWRDGGRNARTFFPCEDPSDWSLELVFTLTAPWALDYYTFLIVSFKHFILFSAVFTRVFSTVIIKYLNCAQ